MLRASLQAGCGIITGVMLIVLPSLAGFNLFDFPWRYWSAMFVAGMGVASINRDNFVLAPTWIVLGECLCLQDWRAFVGSLFILHFAAVPACLGATAAVGALELIDSYKLLRDEATETMNELPFWEE